MLSTNKEDIEQVFPMCRSLIDRGIWQEILIASGNDSNPESFSETLSRQAAGRRIFDFIPDLGRLELALYKSADPSTEFPHTISRLSVNPTLQVLDVAWRNLSSFFVEIDETIDDPVPGDEVLLVWREKPEGSPRLQKAAPEDLLALKIIVEDLPPAVVARDGNIPVGAIDTLVRNAVSKGLLLSPGSKIKRDPSCLTEMNSDALHFRTAEVFTLQWHITQKCDLHCKHCYDRSDRTPLPLDLGNKILDDMRTFCMDRSVSGQVSFSGGNPLLYPHFLDLYRGTFDRGLSAAILGNPAPRKTIQELLSIGPPVFYQISLEGLEDHNDLIRGRGHFSRAVDFLGILKVLGIFSMVMLTLTRDNQDQVLPLAEFLRNKADLFTFNRISLVGEGANLHPVEKNKFQSFLADYMAAANENPIMSLKDNFFSLLRHNQGLEPAGGCTGFGCGAAFNFLSVLPDGEVHACRKFPSPLGNVFSHGLAGIYDSDQAAKYRKRCDECAECAVKASCGGCLAVSHSSGLDIFRSRDPYCFLNS